MATIYRTYRPATFKEVVGQEHVTQALSRAVTSDRLTHAYLFYGPRGTGKTTTARILAKRVNCLNPQEAEPCGKCDSCVALAKGRHLDVIEIDAASNRGIDDVRSLRETIASSPTLGAYKIYIIDEVHMLTNEASTALLKTLEEPVKHAIFILATTELHKVLPTIISRCQVYRFRRATATELTGRLRWLLKQEKRTAADDVLDFIVERSDGCYRDAESLLGQLLTLQEKELALTGLVDLLGLPSQTALERFLQALVRGESAPALAAADEVFTSGVDPEQFLREAVRMARDGAVKLATGVTSDKSFAAEEGASQRLPVIMRTLLQAVQDLAYVPEPLLAVQLAVVSLCSTKGDVPSGKKQVAATVSPAVAASKPQRETATDKRTVKKQIKKVAKPAPQQSAQSEGGLTVEHIKAVWDRLIDGVKKDNPVASTFLRAVQPIEVQGGAITVRTQYSLHRTFLETPKNKQLIEQTLADLLSTKVTVRPLFDETGAAGKASVAERRQQRESDFYSSVKDVFN